MPSLPPEAHKDPSGEIAVVYSPKQFKEGVTEPHKNRDKYSNRNSREKFFENVFFEAWRLRKRFQMIVFIAAIVSDKFSSRSELSSRFFGRLKFFVLFEYLGLF